jgi:hypothetical protein
MSTALLTPPADAQTLQLFCRRINPGGPGWRAVYRQLEEKGEAPVDSGVNIPRGILCMVLGCAAVYGVLFGTGFAIYGETVNAIILLAVSIAAAAGIVVLRFND